MSITLNWMDPQKTRLRIAYHSAWTRAALRLVIEQAVQMLNEISQPTHLIVDQREVPVATSEFLLHVQWLTAVTRHANANQVVVTGAPIETQRLCEGYTYGENTAHNFHFCKTLDEAETFLSQFDFLTQLGNLNISEA